MKTASKNAPEINIPIAVIEFGLQAGYKNSTSNSSQNISTASTTTVRFEMDRDEISSIVKQLEQVQKVATQLASI